MIDPATLNAIFNGATVLFTGGVLGVLLRYRQGMKNLDNIANADIRDHYAEELSRVIERQRECEEREEKLRNRIRELEYDVLGLIRIIRQASADKVIFLSDEVSKDILEMAQRISNRPLDER